MIIRMMQAFIDTSNPMFLHCRNFFERKAKSINHEEQLWNVDSVGMVVELDGDDEEDEENQKTLGINEFSEDELGTAHT